MCVCVLRAEGESVCAAPLTGMVEEDKSFDPFLFGSEMASPQGCKSAKNLIIVIKIQSQIQGSWIYRTYESRFIKSFPINNQEK